MELILRQVSPMTTLALLISPEQIEQESCACTQPEESNKRMYPDDAWDLSERGRNVANTSRNRKNGKNCMQNHT